MPNDTTPAPIGADGALALLVAAVEAETDQSWECNSYHPSLWSALNVARAALATAAQPPAGIWVPTELAERVQETLGEFLMDHGWRQQDMDTSDEFGALLAAAPKAGPAQPERVPLTEEQLKQIHHIEEFGLFCDYSEFEQIARAIELAHGIKPTEQSND